MDYDSFDVVESVTVPYFIWIKMWKTWPNEGNEANWCARFNECKNSTNMTLFVGKRIFFFKKHSIQVINFALNTHTERERKMPSPSKEVTVKQILFSYIFLWAPLFPFHFTEWKPIIRYSAVIFKIDDQRRNDQHRMCVQNEKKKIFLCQFRFIFMWKTSAVAPLTRNTCYTGIYWIWCDCTAKSGNDS